MGRKKTEELAELSSEPGDRLFRNALSVHLRTLLVALTATGGLAGCGGYGVSGGNPVPSSPLRYQEATGGCCAGLVYRTRGTGYYPASNRLQGGFVDRRGKKLRTLQDFIDGRVNTVSVAMDPKVLPYGSSVCIPALNAKYGKTIAFRVVDTGGAFIEKGLSRIDICTRSKADAHEKTINQKFDLVVCK